MVSFSNLELNNHCYICGKNITYLNGTRDHFIPKILGGSNLVENIRPACDFCNSKKNCLVPTTGLLFTVLVANIIATDRPVVSGEHLSVLKITTHSVASNMYCIHLKPSAFGLVNVIVKSGIASFTVTGITETSRMKDVTKIANKAVKSASKHIAYLEQVSEGNWPINYWRGYLCGIDNDLLLSHRACDNDRKDVIEPIENAVSTQEINKPFHKIGGTETQMAECAICGKHLDFQGDKVKLICPECTAVICKFNLIDGSIIYLLRSRQSVVERLQDIVSGITTIPHEDVPSEMASSFSQEDEESSIEVEHDSLLSSFSVQ